MALPNIEDYDAILDRTCADVVGDTISYKAVGAAGYSDKQAHVDYRDGEVTLGSTEAIEQNISIEIMKSDVPAKPTKAVRIQLPKVPGATFAPINVRTGSSGTHWVFELKGVAA